ncbi:MGMT family protein [Candidatus Dependentiae bacterium]|nr:MGMT family protein [Candidatus Dependentiae bacterium]
MPEILDHYFELENVGKIKLTFHENQNKLKLKRIYLPGSFKYIESYYNNFHTYTTNKIKQNSGKQTINIIKKYIIYANAGINQKINFTLFDFSGLTDFQKKILFTLFKKIKRGDTVSYKKLGDIAGFKNTARAVGNSMAKNPFPIIFPCHRVICSNGTIGNFQGNQFLKNILLNIEKNIYRKKN